MLEFAGQTALALMASGALLLSYRRIRRSAPLAAHLFTIGLLARIAIGLGLAMSWLAAGTPNGIDGPDPRWFPDAQMYYVAAVDAAANGLGRVEDTEASPVFVRALALWMRFTGDTHAGALLGLGAVFVPVSLLRATGLVSFEGGGRFLLLTDIDTLYLDGAVAWCLAFVWRRRAAITGGWTLAAVLLLLGTVGAVLVGYVVTNYGTLFRLRLLAVVPFWLLPLVVADRSTDRAD